MKILIFLSSLLCADAYDTVFQQGLAQIDAQNYEAAAQSFEQLVSEGVQSAPLFYNLALAYHQAGEKGAALANYERALRLNPRLMAAQDNQKLLLAALERPKSPPMPPAWQEALLFWHHDLGYSTVRGFALAAWCTLWILLILRRWWFIPYLVPVATVLSLVSLLCGLSAWVKAHPLPLAVAAGETVPVYYGIQDTGAVRFELFEGERVKIEDRKGDWLRIKNVEGDDGWVQGENLIEVGPPYEAWKPQNKVGATEPTQGKKTDTGV